MTTAAEPLAIVHVAGPTEIETRASGAARKPVAVHVQRCLRCDAIVFEASGRSIYPVGTRVALAPTGGRMKRYALGGRALRLSERLCEPTPVEFL